MFKYGIVDACLFKVRVIHKHCNSPTMMYKVSNSGREIYDMFKYQIVNACLPTVVAIH